MVSPSTPNRSADALRKKEISLIHIGAGKLGLDEETRRAMYGTVTGKSSCSDMSWQERKAVLDHLKAKGFKITTPRKAGNPRPAAPSRTLDTSALASKVRALWLGLHELGAVRDASEAALGAYCKRIAKVDALQWASGGQLETLIETLKKWVIRVCRALAPGLMETVRGLDLQDYDRHEYEVAYRLLMDPAAKPQLGDECAQDFIAELRRQVSGDVQ